MSAILPVKHTVSLESFLPSRRHVGSAFRILLVFALLAGIVAVVMLLPGPKAGDLDQLPSANAGPVAVRSASALRDHGFFVVQGEAVNESARPARRLEAVVELFDSRGSLRAVESALVEMPLIAPHEESPFEVHLPDPGNVRSFRVRFRPVAGSAIP